jgi:hypothetical protein
VIAAGGLVLDVPALTALAANRSVYLRALIAHARNRGLTLVVPAAALSAAGAVVDDLARAELAWAVDRPHVLVSPLDAVSALDVAVTARQSNLTDDIVGAQVVRDARARRWAIVTDKDAAVRWRALGLDADELP